MLATIPTTAPLTSLVTFSVISALASSISSRTSSEARSETSWTARPSSDVEWSSAMSVHQPLEDPGEQEGAREGGCHKDLRALRRDVAGAAAVAAAGREGGGAARGRVPRGCRRCAGVGPTADAGTGDART